MRVALVSLDSQWEDKEANFAACTNYVQAAAALDAQAIIFPEMTLTGFSVCNPALAEKAHDSWTLRSFTALAAQFKMELVFGMICEHEGGLVNRLYVLAADGSVTGYYDKIHLFAPGQESKCFKAGQTRLLATLGNMPAAFSICYDLRFPELYTTLPQSTELLVNIASWPATRIGHWQTLLAARAIEQRAFVIGVNRTGQDGNQLSYVASSAVYNPDGQVLAPLVTQGNLAVFNIEQDIVRQSRALFDPRHDRCGQDYANWQKENV